MQISSEWNISKQWLMVHCVGGLLENNISKIVAMATLGGGTAAAKKILIVGNRLARKNTNRCRLRSGIFQPAVGPTEQTFTARSTTIQGSEYHHYKSLDW